MFGAGRRAAVGEGSRKQAAQLLGRGSDLQLKVSVSIESFTGTNIHPKINFPFFLFL